MMSARIGGASGVQSQVSSGSRCLGGILLRSEVQLEGKERAEELEFILSCMVFLSGGTCLEEGMNLGSTTLCLVLCSGLKGVLRAITARSIFPRPCLLEQEIRGSFGLDQEIRDFSGLEQEIRDSLDVSG